MNARFWALPMVLCFAMMLIVAPVFAATFEPRSKQSQQLKALVDKAAALVESEGQHAFPEFRKKGSAWYKGDLYLFEVRREGLTSITRLSRSPFRS